MHWILALAGAVVGAMAGSASAAFLGLTAGTLLGWQWGRIRTLGRHLEEVEARVRVLQSIQSAGTKATPPAAVQEVVAPSPDAGEPAPQRSVDIAQPAAAETPPAAAPVHTLAVGSGPEPPTPSIVAGDDDPDSSGASMGGRHTAPAADAGVGATRTPPQIVSNEYFQTTIPHGSSPLERGIRRVREWFFGGNVPVKVGMLVLLFGVAAALKYSIDAGWVQVSLPLRLSMLAAGGLAAVIWGWRNREVRPAFGLSLQGGGIGILLLTTFAAYRLYALVPSGMAMGLVLALVAGAALLAVLQDAVALAVLGFLGGYLAPVLLSTGGGSHVALFSYYAVLNLAVFAIAWVRHWRALNLIGFTFTFLIGLGWGARYYRPEHFATVEPFLILFFGFYVGIAVLHALRAPGRLRGLVDGPILFGTPLVAFGLQAAMLHDAPMALAWSAMAVAALYAALAFWLIRRPGLLLLGQSFAALAAGFATLAVPLALSARSTAITWALEGVALVWLGLRQQRVLPQISGLALQALAALAYFAGLFDSGWDAAAGEWPWLNGHALVVLLLCASALATSRLYERAGAGRLLVWPGTLIGTAWWYLAGLRELNQHSHRWGELTLGMEQPMSWIGFAAFTLLVMSVLRRALRWPRLGWQVPLALGLSLVAVLCDLSDAQQALRWPRAGIWLAWTAAALTALALLRAPRQRGLGASHLLLLGLLALVFGVALVQEARHALLGEDWVFALGLAPLLFLAATTWRLPALGAFPLAREFPAYAPFWFALAGVALAAAWVQSLALSGDTRPLPYLPLLNPAELLQLLGVALATRLALRRKFKPAPALAAGAMFVVLSLAGLRAVHIYSGLPWNPWILDHGVAQTTLTVLWSLLGVAAWVLGSRRRHWSLWLTGAIGMGVVLLKLVAVDRQYVGNLTGIVSFMAVGLLLVLVGRIAPTPPRNISRQEADR